ncbi:MAG: hypothetical protein NVSMB9_24150 [Isosphaeraceae bacterium]
MANPSLPGKTKELDEGVRRAMATTLVKDDRRSMLRYPSVMGRAWVGWKERNEFRHHAAWLIDIGWGGCLVAMDEEPPTDRVVQLQIAGPYLPKWFEARVLDVRIGAKGVCAARLSFPEGCPYELFMGVVYGQFRREPAKEEPPKKNAPSPRWGVGR